MTVDPIGFNMCAEYKVNVLRRNGTFIAELGPWDRLVWTRQRDDVSTFILELGAVDCCESLSEASVLITEVQVMRNNALVWAGVVTRIEFENTKTVVYAEDLLVIPKDTVLARNYDYSYPNISAAGYAMKRLLTEFCFSLNGDPWRMTNNIRWLTSAKEALTSRKVHAFSTKVFDDFDKYAEDSGMDYTVVGRTIYIWDVHYAWHVLPPLEETDIRGEFAIVEYSSDFATRVYVSNGNGYAAVATSPKSITDVYGFIDSLIMDVNDNPPENPDDPPTAEDLKRMQDTAQRNLEAMDEVRLQVRVSENSELVPDGAWDVEDMIPGSWFLASASTGCRTVETWMRLDSITVQVTNDGESISFTSTTAPRTRINP